MFGAISEKFRTFDMQINFAMGKEVEMLEKQTDTYLENIDNQPPATTR